MSTVPTRHLTISANRTGRRRHHLQSDPAPTANRYANFPTWVKQIHPDTFAATDPTRIPTGYLIDLYPNIWAWGPRGDTYTAQLTRLGDILDSITHNRHPLFNDLDLSSLDTFINSPAGNDLATHARANGLPANTLTITHGMDFQEDHLYDPAYDTTPAQRLILHPCWETHGFGIINFGEFLGRFALISIHHAFLRGQPDAVAALTTYHTFCRTWELPT